jgi:hypothetical protein
MWALAANDDDVWRYAAAGGWRLHDRVEGCGRFEAEPGASFLALG